MCSTTESCFITMLARIKKDGDVHVLTDHLYQQTSIELGILMWMRVPVKNTVVANTSPHLKPILITIQDIILLPDIVIRHGSKSQPNNTGPSKDVPNQH